jgi:hypothetical protein
MGTVNLYTEFIFAVETMHSIVLRCTIKSQTLAMISSIARKTVCQTGFLRKHFEGG